MSDYVMAATHWRTNADLIADVARLGYLKPTDYILDPTYGNGAWWAKWEPITLCHPVGDFDFTKMSDLWSNQFDAVTFDHPYVSPGGRASSNIQSFHAAYGMTHSPRSPTYLQVLINAGLRECRRVVKPNGIVLVKCMNYISSGKLYLGAHLTLSYARRLDFECLDWFEMIRSSSPQSQTRQVHARRNLSTLYVLQKRPCVDCGDWNHYGELCRG